MTDAERILRYPSGVRVLKLIETLAKDAKENMLASVAQLVSEVEVSRPTIKGEDVNNTVARVDITEAACSIPKLQFISPWGSQSLSLFLNDKLVLQNKGTDIVVPLSALKEVAIFDNLPNDSKNKIYIFIILDKAFNVMSGGKRLENILLQTTSDAQLKVQMSGGEILEGAAPVVLCTVLGKAGVQPTAFISPDPELYSNLKGNGALQVSLGATQGALFPMETALFFLPKPATYIAHEDIESYELQRMDASFKCSNLLLCLKGVAKPLDFGFDRPEALRVQSYLKERRIKEFVKEAPPVKKARGQDAVIDVEEGGCGKRSRKEVLADASDEKIGSKKGRRETKVAPQTEEEAVLMDDDDDDDEDFNGEESEDDSDSDSDEISEEESEGEGEVDEEEVEEEEDEEEDEEE